jgi:hypothetical protein
VVSEHRDLLFAEALHYFELGEPFHDTMEEMQSAGAARRPFRSGSSPRRGTCKLIEHVEIPARAASPERGETGHSGILTTSTSPTSSECSTCRQSVQHMSDAQLAAFLRRAGYQPSRSQLSARGEIGQDLRVGAPGAPATDGGAVQGVFVLLPGTLSRRVGAAPLGRAPGGPPGVGVAPSAGRVE